MPVANRIRSVTAATAPSATSGSSSFVAGSMIRFRCERFTAEPVVGCSAP